MVRHQNIHSAKSLHGGSHHSLRRVGIGKIGFQMLGVSAEAAQLGKQGRDARAVRPPRLGGVERRIRVNKKIGPESRKAGGNPKANPRTAADAGDDGNAPH